MALVTYAAAMLLTPIVLSVLSVPSVLNGGGVPCNPFIHYQFQCPVGLHGSAAIGALINGEVETYPLALVAALLFFLPSMAVLVVPAAAWHRMVRRELKKLADQRS